VLKHTDTAGAKAFATRQVLTGVYFSRIRIRSKLIRRQVSE